MLQVQLTGGCPFDGHSFNYAHILDLIEFSLSAPAFKLEDPC